MIRKLEHERDKLSTQLERVQEGASSAKKVAKENEHQATKRAEQCARLEAELVRMSHEKEITDETGDLAHQERRLYLDERGRI